MNDLTRIGKIISVSGNSVTVKVDDNVKSNLPIIDGVVYKIGQIGSFLKIPQGYCNLYGIVTQIGADAVPKSILEKMSVSEYVETGNQQWLTITLIGEQTGRRFERGISQSPTTEDIVHLVTVEDLKCIYDNFGDSCTIKVGSISSSGTLPALLDLDKIVSRHLAILGSTGSGKSNAVGVILNAIIEKNFPRTRVLIMDPHGEYSSIFNSEDVQIFGGVSESPLFIPYWALPFNELMSIFPGNITEQNTEYIRSKISEAKKIGAKANGIKIDEDVITADSPVPFSIKQLWFDLYNFEIMTLNKARDLSSCCSPTKKGDPEKMIADEYPPATTINSAPFINTYGKGIQSFLDGVRIRIKDTRYSFLFQPGEYMPDLKGKVNNDISELLCAWLGNEKKITIIDFSDVPADILSSVSGTMLSIIYDALFWGQNLSNGGKKQPIMIVLEEAHNYLRAGVNSIASRSVQRIAKEGRKYGVGLTLVTQRPSELDETVLSQCGTIISLRMNNSKDRGHVVGAIQDELRTMVDMLPSLRTGEAIVSGEGVKLPSRIQFSKVKNTSKGSDPDVSKEWAKEYCEEDKDYSQIVDLWRNKKFIMEE